MKKILSIFLFVSLLVSCVPPGKLSEALDANTMLNSKYDSLYNKLNDTIANYTNSMRILKLNASSLNDSISYYHALAAKPPVLTDGDIFLNQLLGLSLLSKSELPVIEKVSGSNANANNDSWLTNFKADFKKYTATDAEVKLNKGFVFVDLSDKILFNSGSYTLTKKSAQVLGTIAQLLKAHPDLNFMIEGHTDSKAFKGKTANNNWTLSVNRATAVARIFQTKYKINPKRIIAAGRSQYVPLDDNKTKVGRSNNRRIRIVIMPGLAQIMNLK